VRVCMDENSDGAARVMHVSSAEARSSSSQSEYALDDLGKRIRFDRLRLRDRHWGRSRPFCGRQVAGIQPTTRYSRGLL
jgi:hypothetical protein